MPRLVLQFATARLTALAQERRVATESAWETSVLNRTRIVGKGEV